MSLERDRPPSAPRPMFITNAPGARPGALTLPLETTKNPVQMAVEAYCVKCKAKRDMKDPKENIMANGRRAMKGTCPTCGTGMFKIMGKA